MKTTQAKTSIMDEIFFFFTSEVKAIFEFQGIASQVFPLMLRIHENFSTFSLTVVKEDARLWGENP